MFSIMKKILLLLIIAFGLVNSCNFLSASDSLAIFYTGTVRGEIDPCG